MLLLWGPLISPNRFLELKTWVDKILLPSNVFGDMREKEDRAVAPLIDSIKWRIDYAGGRTVAIRVLLTDKDDFIY